MSNPNDTKGSPASKLYQQLFQKPSQEEKYALYFRQELWSVKEVRALLIGTTPEKFEELEKQKTNGLSLGILKKLQAAYHTTERVLTYIEKELYSIALFHDGDIYLSPWQYIKWLALNKIKISIKFFDHLPLFLKELYLEFQPINVALRTASIYSKPYHKARYQQLAQKVIEGSNRKLTHEEIFHLPCMQSLREGLRRQIPARADEPLPKPYSKRVCKRWIAAIDPRKKGRPRKNPSK